MRKRQELLGPTVEDSHAVVFPRKTWINQELSGCKFKDARHGKRIGKLLVQLSEEIGGSIPWACQDWANTKAAYRFFSNDRVSEAEILAGHFQATQAQDRDNIVAQADIEFEITQGM